MNIATLSTNPSAADIPAGSRDSAILVADNLVKRFDTPDGPITAVENVSFSIRETEFVSLIGPSGCGKSTVFNIVGGMISDYQGSVSVDGERIRGPHKSIGMVFQEESTFPWAHGDRECEFPARNRRHR